MENKESVFKKIMKSIKNLFVRLFGFGKHKNELDDELIIKDEGKKSSVLKEEEILSPTRQIFKKFINNKVAIVGLVIFTGILLFIIIGSNVIDFNKSYQETSQIYLPPSMGYTKVPKNLKKEGVKFVEDEDGNEVPLMGLGNAFTVAISNANNVYVWGAGVHNIKKIPAEVKEKAKDIVQLSVGSQHVVALTKDKEILSWGNNTFEITQIPIYNPGTDAAFYEYKKSIQAYFMPEARTLYPGSVVTKIEEDPIYKIYAGDNFTSVLTESGVVYTWGITKTLGISEPDKSTNALDVVILLSEGNLKWRYNVEVNKSAKTFLTFDDIVTRFSIPEVDLNGDKTSIRIYSNKLQYLEVTVEEVNEEEVKTQEWKDLIAISDLITELEPITNNKIVKIHILYEHILYELEDNSFIITGYIGPVLDRFPVELTQSAAERGYRISTVQGSFKNGIYLTEAGNIHVWGEATAENKLNNIPEAVVNSKIISITTGATFMTAVDENGTPYLWGYKNRLNELNMPENMPKTKTLVTDFFIGYSIGEDGSITSWGNNGHFFGTDQNGADNLYRIIAGGTKTLTLAAVAVAVSLVLGLTVGLIAGFYGRWVDNLLMRFGEIVNSFPFLPLAMTLAIVVQEYNFSDTTRVYLIMVVLGLLSWPGLARLVRGQILSEREKDYIMAAKALGVKERHIIVRHILPNVINVVIVSTTLSYAGSLLTESGLSFLGFGVKAPEPSWGNMLTGAQSISVLKNYWWLWIIPAVFIVLTALSVNLVGDGLREAMDPKSNER